MKFGPFTIDDEKAKKWLEDFRREHPETVLYLANPMHRWLVSVLGDTHYCNVCRASGRIGPTGEIYIRTRVASRGCGALYLASTKVPCGLTAHEREKLGGETSKEVWGA